MKFSALVEPGSGGEADVPWITEDGGLGVQPGEEVLASVAWTELRIHRGDIWSDPDLTLPCVGLLTVTNTRVAWMTDQILKGRASNKPGYTAVALTGSVVAGWLTDAAVGRRARRKNRGILAGQLQATWVDYVGYFQPENFLRLGVHDEFTDKVEPVYIDFALAPDFSAATLATTLVDEYRAARASDDHVSPEDRSQMAQVALPATRSDGLLVSARLPGWKTTRA